MFTVFFLYSCSKDDAVVTPTAPTKPDGNWKLTINSLIGHLHFTATGNSLGGNLTFEGYTGSSSVIGSFTSDSIKYSFQTTETLDFAYTANWKHRGVYDLTSSTMVGTGEVRKQTNDSLLLTFNWSAIKE